MIDSQTKESYSDETKLFLSSINILTFDKRKVSFVTQIAKGNFQIKGKFLQMLLNIRATVDKLHLNTHSV